MATLTSNVDIDYVTKDYNSSVDALIAFATVNFGPGTSANRLWTDFNTDSFSRNWLEMLSYIADTFYFYMDVQATQSYLQTATIPAAVANIAKQFGFVPATAQSASGVANFTLTAAGTILIGFRVQATNGEQFYLTNKIVAGSAGVYSGSVLQGIIKSEQFIAQGIQNEQFNLTGPNVIKDLTNLNPQDISPQVAVNGNSYALVNTFINSVGSDTTAITDAFGNVIGGGRVFELDQRPNGTPFVTFGDGVFGRKLNPGEVITVTYRTGGGTAGNIGKQTLTTLLDSAAFVSSVTNATDFSGGSDAQTIAQLQQLIPASLRTLDRAVSKQDYSDILISNFPQIQAASAEQNTTDPGVDVNVYVVPTGSTITKITDNVALKNTLTNFIDLRKMVTVQFKILDAYGLDVLISLEVHISDTSSQSAIEQSITTVLQNFFNLTTGGPTGAGLSFASKVLTEDISALLKTISGIERFEIKEFTYRPRIDDKVVGLTTTYNHSNVDIFKKVGQYEWLLAAAGPVTEATGTLIFHNNNVATFTYTSGTGKIQYTSNILPETLNSVAPGDLLRSGPGSGSIDATILAVDSKNKTLYISTGLTFDTTPGVNAGGSIRQGASSFQSFKCFKKILATATNLSVNSITDTNLDLSIKSGTGVELSPTVLLDNIQTFIPGEFATGNYYLLDGASNIWEILANDSDTITTSITAVNDAAISVVTGGSYRIVLKLVSYQIIFNGNIFNINYNTHNTLFSIGGQFVNIGTIGNSFEISKTQNNVGSLGVALNLISFDAPSGTVQLNNQPDLSGVSANDFMIDSSGQIFKITSVDNRLEPSIAYDSSHYNTSLILTGSSTNSKFAQGFKVSATTTYPVVSWYLRREGNIAGNLTAQIVNDSAGLPNLSSVVATTNLLNVSALSETLTKVVFGFVTPPTLTSGIQYHLVLTGDAGYVINQKDNVKTFDNDLAATAYTYNSISGIVQYALPVELSSVLPGNYIKDKVSNFFKVLSVNVAGNNVTIATGAIFVDDSPVFSAITGSGSIYSKDNVYVGIDSVTPIYPDGVFDSYNGSVWSPHSPASDAIFSVEGPKIIVVNSNLTPVLGPGATIGSRYYDDNNEISLILGISAGIETFATDVNALGLGTVASVPNSKVDTFTFRTSGYNDDITNLRANEIAQIIASDININMFGGVS